MSHVLGERFDYVEVTGNRTGIMMTYHSPCRICGSEVPEGEACRTCILNYEKKPPRSSTRSREINRAYRLEAAVATAGELAELKLNNGKILASDEELETDRARVSSRASLRHLWQKDACSNYCGGPSDCGTCTNAAEELQRSIRQVLDRPEVWSGVLSVADELKARTRISGADAHGLLEQLGVPFGSSDIDVIWPPLP